MISNLLMKRNKSLDSLKNYAPNYNNKSKIVFKMNKTSSVSNKKANYRANKKISRGCRRKSEN